MTLYYGEIKYVYCSFEFFLCKKNYILFLNRIFFVFLFQKNSGISEAKH